MNKPPSKRQKSKHAATKKRDMSIYPQEKMMESMMQVFKFAAGFYLTI